MYFTADWCVNLQVNERVALSTDAVAQAFAQLDIRVVMGDWTNQDPTIAEWLQRYGRAGVPLYLYFPRGASLDTAVILPQVLLPEVVIEAVGPVRGGNCASIPPTRRAGKEEMPVLESKLDTRSEAFQRNRADMLEALAEIQALLDDAAEGGGAEARARLAGAQNAHPRAHITRARPGLAVSGDQPARRLAL